MSDLATTGDSMLLVANYDSDVGYAWWLMESFWAMLADHFAGRFATWLAYPSISTLPTAIAAAPLTTVAIDFTARSPLGLWRQVRFIRHRRVRVIYFTDQRAVDWRYPIFRAAGVRSILVHDHTPGQRQGPRGLRRRLKTFLHRHHHLAADAMIGATAFVSERHRRVNCFPPTRCFVAENGLPARSTVAAVSVHQRFGIPEGRRVIVSVGRAHRVKGIDLTLKALAILLHDRGRKDLHFLHCGDGPDLERLQQISERLALGDHVTFAGRQDDIPALLQSCTLAMHASTAEVGYSLSILEYMEAGLPVVVSDDASVAGATEHDVTGLHFQTGHPERAADALARLLDDPASAARMGHAARLRLQQRFTLDRTHAMLRAAFDEVLDPDSSPATAPDHASSTHQGISHVRG